jgi:hypothetical protein
VERLALIDHRQHAPDKFIALKVGELAQLGRAAEMRRIKGIASRAPQRAFFCDFD